MPRTNFDFISIGTATRDVFLTSPHFKVLKDEKHLKEIGFPDGKAECFAFGGKIEIDEAIFCTGGGALNSAVTAARQGLSAGAIISLGKDRTAEDVLDELKAEKVEAIVSYSKEANTGYSTLLLNEDGERTILVARGAASELNVTIGDIENLKTHWVYIVPGSIPLSKIQSLVNHFKRQGSLVAMNPSGHYLQMGQRRLTAVLKKLDLLILNRSEGALLTKLEKDDERKIFKKINDLTSCPTIMTDGQNGVLFSDGKTIYRSGVFQEKVVKDRTGAGDAFGSAFVSSLVQEKSDPANLSITEIKKALRFASANATSVVEHIGAKKGILNQGEFDRSRRFKNLSVRKTLL